MKRGFALIELIIAIIVITLILLAVIFIFKPERTKSTGFRSPEVSGRII